MKKILNNSLGLSLVEIGIALGLMGAASLVVMQMNNNQVLGVKRAQENMEIMEVSNRVTQALIDSKGCMNTLRGHSLESTESSLDAIVNTYGKSIVKEGEEIGNKLIKVKDISLVDVVTDGNNGSANVRINFVKQSKFVQGKSTAERKITKNFPISFSLKNGALSSCYNTTDTAEDESFGNLCVLIGGTVSGGSCNFKSFDTLDLNTSSPGITSFAVSTRYLDDFYNQYIESSYLPLAGGDVKGPLTLTGKTIVDSSVAAIGSEICIGSACREFVKTECSDGEVVSGIDATNGSVICKNVKALFSKQLCGTGKDISVDPTTKAVICIEKEEVPNKCEDGSDPVCVGKCSGSWVETSKVETDDGSCGAKIGPITVGATEGSCQVTPKYCQYNMSDCVSIFGIPNPCTSNSDRTKKIDEACREAGDKGTCEGTLCSWRESSATSEACAAMTKAQCDPFIEITPNGCSWVTKSSNNDGSNISCTGLSKSSCLDKSTRCAWYPAIKIDFSGMCIGGTYSTPAGPGPCRKKNLPFNSTTSWKAVSGSHCAGFTDSASCNRETNLSHTGTYFSCSWQGGPGTSGSCFDLKTEAGCKSHSECSWGGLSDPEVTEVTKQCSEADSASSCSSQNSACSWDSCAEKSCSVPVKSSAVNGVCNNAQVDKCFGGVMRPEVDSDFFHKWKCEGSKGGKSASCQKKKEKTKDSLCALPSNPRSVTECNQECPDSKMNLCIAGDTEFTNSVYCPPGKECFCAESCNSSQSNTYSWSNSTRLGCYESGGERAGRKCVDLVKSTCMDNGTSAVSATNCPRLPSDLPSGYENRLFMEGFGCNESSVGCWGKEITCPTVGTACFKNR